MIRSNAINSVSSLEHFYMGEELWQRTLFRSPHQISARPCAETDSWSNG